MSTSFTSTEFDRDVMAAKRAAEHGPVTITENGRRSYVLLTAKEFDRLSGNLEPMGDILWGDQDVDVDLDLPKRRVEPMRDVSL